MFLQQRNNAALFFHSFYTIQLTSLFLILELPLFRLIDLSSLDIGANYYINGHFVKLTLEYHCITRDIREEAIAIGDDSLSQLQLQLHDFL